MHTEVTAYIETFPEETQTILKKIHTIIQREAPDAVDLIGYGIPTFKIDGKNLVHYAAYKKHIGFYPAPSAIQHFQKELHGYTQAKGSVQFPLDQPIPYDLIKQITQFRVAETNS